MFEERPAWQADAACNTADASLVDVFFGAGRRDFDGARAKQICAVCPVRTECLDYALDHDPPIPPGQDGVWGGLTHLERVQLRHQLGVSA